MAQVQHFEDLVAGQKARVLTKRIYAATRQPAFSKDFGLRDQIQRASVSIMANIAEGFERHGLKEFHQFLSIAKGSCAEVRAHLYVALDAGYLSESEFSEIRDMAEEVTRIIAGLRSSLERQL